VEKYYNPKDHNLNITRTSLLLPSDDISLADKHFFHNSFLVYHLVVSSLQVHNFSTSALGPTQPPIQWVLVCSLPGGKVAGAWSWPFTSI